MIKDIRIRINVDKRDKITCGRKSDKGYPQSLDYFNIDAFPELRAAYGDKPKKLVLFFPTDNIADFFDCNYVLYAGAGEKSVKVRSCDGETCIHRINETVGGIDYKSGQSSECVCRSLAENDKKRCKYAMYLKAWIADIKQGRVISPICYMFETHSKNSGDNIYSELVKIQTMNKGVLRGIPFGLSVDMVEGKTEAKQKFPIWGLQVIVNVLEMGERGFYSLDVPKKNRELPQTTATKNNDGSLGL